MRRFLTRTGLTAAAIALGLFVHTASARAQFVQVFSPPVMVAPAPVFTFSPPVTSFYAAPVTSFYAPAPTVSFYPSTTVFSAPVAVAAPTTFVSPATVTTRTFVGYGIFRPRGVYTQNFVTPAPVVAPTTSFYSPVFVR